MPPETAEEPDALSSAPSSLGGLLSGEIRRKIDDRFRVSLPGEFAEAVGDAVGESVLVKERFGCLSLWPAEDWRRRFEGDVQIIRQKILADKLADRRADVQRLGRLISTRSTPVKLAGRGRLLLPDSFRDFLGVGANEEVMVVGAMVCVEIWQPAAWVEQLQQDMPDFGELLAGLSA